MPAATGYYLPGDSWLHRRNPLTKLLALGWVLLATFLLPPWVLPILIVIVVLDCLVRRDPAQPGPRDAHPGRPAPVDPRRQRVPLPRRHGRDRRVRPVRDHARGADVRADLGGARPGRVPRLGDVPPDDARRRPAGVAHRTGREPPDRLRRAVRGPDGPSTPGACRVDPRGPAGSRTARDRLDRDADPGARCRSSGRCCSGR